MDISAPLSKMIRSDSGLILNSPKRKESAIFYFRIIVDKLLVSCFFLWKKTSFITYFSK